MVTVEWKGAKRFDAHTPTNNTLVMDAYPEEGQSSAGPTPLEALLAALGGCSAIDVLAILEKKRQTVTSYRVEVTGERAEPGTWPRPFTKLVVKHIVAGENLDPAAVERAVQLSDEKYCSVISTLRATPEVVSVWEVEDSA